MYRMIVDRYEEKIKYLTTENTDLRKSLKELQKELQDILSTHKVTNLQTNGESANTDIMNDSQFNLPFDMIRDSLEDSMKQKLDLLREKFESLQATDAEYLDYESVVEKLRNIMNIFKVNNIDVNRRI
jgi:molecular chaperone GrpE (heat shock protein)